MDRAKAADISGLVPAGPKDPTPDAQRLEAERLALAQDSALRKAILSEVGLVMRRRIHVICASYEEEDTCQRLVSS